MTVAYFICPVVRAGYSSYLIGCHVYITLSPVQPTPTYNLSYPFRPGDVILWIFFPYIILCVFCIMSVILQLSKLSYRICLVSRAIRICECASGARARKGGRGKKTYGVSVASSYSGFRRSCNRKASCVARMRRYKRLKTSFL